MAKGNKGKQVGTAVTQPAAVVAAAPAATPQPVVLYGLGKLPRNGLNTVTKHGQGGTAGTYAAIVAALQGAPNGLSITAIQAVCKANGDPGFAKYAVRNHWLQPVQATTAN